MRGVLGEGVWRMSTWEVLKLCGLYIWYNNAPVWVDWFCDMAPAFAILGGIALGIVSEVIATEPEDLGE